MKGLRRGLQFLISSPEKFNLLLHCSSKICSSRSIHSQTLQQVSFLSCVVQEQSLAHIPSGRAWSWFRRLESRRLGQTRVSSDEICEQEVSGGKEAFPRVYDFRRFAPSNRADYAKVGRSTWSPQIHRTDTSASQTIKGKLNRARRYESQQDQEVGSCDGRLGNTEPTGRWGSTQPIGRWGFPQTRDDYNRYTHGNEGAKLGRCATQTPSRDKTEVLSSAPRFFREEVSYTPKSQEDGRPVRHPRRFPGEKKWQYAVRKKQQFASRGQRRKKVQLFEYEEGLGDIPLGEEWKRRRIGWLFGKIPQFKPKEIVSVLNEQRKWFTAVETKLIVEHLVQTGEALRAHRVLKWEMQQPWYSFDFELSTQVANVLGENNKLTRTRDLFDVMIENGKVPDLTTYGLLINCYIADGQNPSLKEAWSLYKQMIQLGGYSPPPTLHYSIFDAFMRKGLPYLDQADEVFRNIKAAGLVASQEMYSLLIHLHGTKGTEERVDTLIAEMKEIGLPVGQDVYGAVLRVCAKDGNTIKGEQVFKDLKAGGEKPRLTVYASVIKMYGKAGMPEKALEAFHEMKAAGINPVITVYEPIIEVMADAGYQDHAEALLRDAQEKNTPSMQACYNALMEMYSKKELVMDVERLFMEMTSKYCRPNINSYNIVISSYVRNEMLPKAEKLYEEMKQDGGIGPNQKTYQLVLEGYGRAKNGEKVKQVFEHLTSRRFEVPEGCGRYLALTVSPKKLEAHKKTILKLSVEQRQMLVGVLLGGARVESHDRNRTYEIHFGQDPEIEAGSRMLNHLYEEFAPWAQEPPSTRYWEDAKDPTKSITVLTFKTVSHGSLRFFAHQYRAKGVPGIPKLIHRWLTPRALAYWYMYGGSKCQKTGGIILNAFSYTDKEISLVLKALQARSMDCERNASDAGSIIRFTDKSAVWLSKLMQPYLLPDLQLNFDSA